MVFCRRGSYDVNAFSNPQVIGVYQHTHASTKPVFLTGIVFHSVEKKKEIKIGPTQAKMLNNASFLNTSSYSLKETMK